MVTLHLIFPSLEFDDTSLSGAERERARAFRFTVDCVRWASFRTSMRSILGSVLGMEARDVPIVTDEFGKPHLAPPHSGIHFSLAHTDDLAILAVSSSGSVGVDLECERRASDLIGCEESFCHPMEINMLPANLEERGMRLLELWTMKEAALKAIGTGLLFPPESVRIETSDSALHRAVCDRSNEAFDGQKIQMIRHPWISGYQAAISSTSVNWELVCREASTPNEWFRSISQLSDRSHG